MKFDYCIGNPPYQGQNHQQLYPSFYLGGRKVAKCVEMIFPIGWQTPKNANNLKKMNNAEIKEDQQIVFIDNKQNAFSGVSGAEWTNIILWKEGFKNGFNGKQKILINGENEKQVRLLINKCDIVKPIEIVRLNDIVKSSQNFQSLKERTSVLKPYGLRTDVLDNQKKYGLPEIYDVPKAKSDIAIYGLKNRKFTKCYLPKNYPLPRTTQNYNKYTVLIGKAWGSFTGKYIGGLYANIIISCPNEICTENFLESGTFDNFITAQKHAKYLMTKFCRALVFMNKYSQDNSRDKWSSVPIQDYSEPWWDETIDQIDEHLFDKYEVPQEIRDFVKRNIQRKDESNIINYTEVAN